MRRTGNTSPEPTTGTYVSGTANSGLGLPMPIPAPVLAQPARPAAAAAAAADPWKKLRRSICLLISERKVWPESAAAGRPFAFFLGSMWRRRRKIAPAELAPACPTPTLGEGDEMATDRAVNQQQAAAAPSRRTLLKTGGAAAAGAAVALSGPFIGDARAATTTTWKVQ